MLQVICRFVFFPTSQSSIIPCGSFLFFFLNFCFGAGPSGLFSCKHWTCILGALKDALFYLSSSVAATFHAVILII